MRMDIYTMTITLILVMDPLGNIPVFISVLNPVEPSRRRFIILRECFFAFLILIAFLFFGRSILMGLGISEPALSIAGGIILFIIAIGMIFPNKQAQSERYSGEPFIVPLCIPLVAGPSALAMILLFVTQHPNKTYQLFFAILVASILVTLVLLTSNPLRKLLGEKGLIAIERLMGMLLTTISVQMFLDGISHYFHLNVS
jgi:MarC family membrane protein